MEISNRLLEKICHAQFVQRLATKYLEKFEKTGDRSCFLCVKKLLESLAGDLAEILKCVAVDPVLGVYTRSIFPYLKEREEALCRRYNLPLSVLFVDVDNLKSVNDKFGHQAGDKLLKCVADVLRSSVRRADIVIRWGGDEFVILLHATKTGAEKVKKRICENLSKKKVSVDGAEFTPSVSIGIAEVSSDLEEAIKLADTRMYFEKRKRKE